MKPLVPSFFVASIALSAAAAQGETIAVLEVRSRVHPVVAAELRDRVLEAVRRAAPEARVVDRDFDADFVVSGKVSRGGLGYRALLELRDRSGDLVQRSSATASTRRELAEAIEGAAGDLLRSRHQPLAAAPVAINPAALPEVPAPAEPPPEDAAPSLEANANVLIAWDRARTVEAHGRERPEEAAEAWRRLATMRGQNPFREIAASRAQQWEAYAAGKRAAFARSRRGEGPEGSARVPRSRLLHRRAGCLRGGRRSLAAGRGARSGPRHGGAPARLRLGKRSGLRAVRADARRRRGR